jgi:ParB family chromosome partitioning protein
MGLAALLGGGPELLAEAPRLEAQLVPTELLRPSGLQPRRRFAEAELDGLARSIRERGVLQPLLVRPAAGAAGYEIVAGERRWRAAQRAGLHELPVVARVLDDRAALELALVENLQREDLGPLEEAAAYRRLIDELGHTQEALAEALGRSRSHIANTLRLLALPPAVRAMLDDGSLSAGHGRALLAAAEPERLALKVVVDGLNVRQTEALARRSAAPLRPPAADPDLAMLERDLAERLGLRVAIRRSGRGGSITLRFSRPEQLERLLRRLA